MPLIAPQQAGFVLAFAGTVAWLFAEPIARWDARVPLLEQFVDERLSLRLVETSSAACLALGVALLFAGGAL